MTEAVAGVWKPQAKGLPPPSAKDFLGLGSWEEEQKRSLQSLRGSLAPLTP